MQHAPKLSAFSNHGQPPARAARRGAHCLRPEARSHLARSHVAWLPRLAAGRGAGILPALPM